MELRMLILAALLSANAIHCATISSPDDFEFLILHNNDMHSRFEQIIGQSKDGRPVGGFARTAHYVKEARKTADADAGPPVLYLNAGDTFTGTVWFTVHRWKIAADFMNALMPDAMCLGNHEFDHGIPGLVPFLQEVKFPILASNLKLNEETQLNNLIQRSVVLNVRGRKIGVVGYVTPDTKIMASVGTLEFLDEVESVKKECDRLINEGVNIIIALGHSGHLMDKKIAKNVKEVDIVIGGHTNTFLWNGYPPDKEIPEDSYPVEVTQKNGKIVPVVQAYAFTKYLGKLLVSFDKNGILKMFSGQPILMDESISEDRDILSLVDSYKPSIQELNTTYLAQSRVFLDGDSCRLQECNFGNLVMDAYVEYPTSSYKGPYWTNTPIALMNSGALRQSINATLRGKNVTKADILGAIPFDQQLFIIEMKGADLMKSLEIGARSNGETSRGEFLMTSGLKVVYNFLKPVGSRVVSVKARCRDCDVPSYSPVQAEQIYRIVTTQFLVRGGDGHTVIRDRPLKFIPLEINDAEAVIRYLETYKIVTPELDERTILSALSSGNKVTFSITSLIFIILYYMC